MPLSKLNHLRFFAAFLIFLNSISVQAELSSGGSTVSPEFSTGAEGNEDAGSRVDPNSCSSTLSDWVKEDFKDKKAMLFVNLPSYAKAACMGPLQKYQTDINKSGAKTPLAESENLSQYLGQRFPQIAPSAKTAMSKCSSLPAGQDRIAKTRYYSAMEKLESYSTSIVDEIAFIDSMIPSGSGLSQIECSKNFPFPKLAERCDSFKAKLREKCDVTPEQRLEKMARRSLMALDDINNLQKAETECLRAGKGKSGCAAIGAMIDKINSENPWLESPEFRVLRSRLNTKQRWHSPSQVENVMKEMQGQSKDSLTKYLTNTRNSLVKSHKSNMNHSRCLTFNESNSSCDFKATKELVRMIPDIPDQTDKRVQSNREYDSHIEAEKCVSRAAQDQEDTRDKMNFAGELAISGGLMLATAGLAGVGAGGLKVVRGMSALNRTRSSAIGLQAATAVVTAGNLAPGVMEAIKSCKTEKEALIKFSSKPEALKSNVCMDLSSQFEQLKDAESSCMVDALLSVADVAPFFKGIRNLRQTRSFTNEELLALYKDKNHREAVEKILAKNGKLTDAERGAAAEALLDKKLTPQQKDCIVSAHHIGGGRIMKTAEATAEDDVLTFADLKQKKQMLDGCGFDVTQVALIMRSGITGLAKVDTSYLQGTLSKSIRQNRNNGTGTTVEQDAIVKKYASEVIGPQTPLSSSEIKAWEDKLRRAGVGEDELKAQVRKMESNSAIAKYEQELKRGGDPGAGYTRLAADAYSNRGDDFAVKATDLYKKEADFLKKRLTQVTNPSHSDYGNLATASRNSGDIDGAISAISRSINDEWESLPSSIRSRAVRQSMEPIDSGTFARARFESFIKEGTSKGGVWKERACEVFKKAGSAYRLNASSVGC